jgi:NADH pyrophosphatase NudC (nudix superfamily)
MPGNRDALITLCDFEPRHCPRCARNTLAAHDGKAVRCDHCGFLYYHNNAAATGVVIWSGDRVLFSERRREPARSLLDMPGGFVDYGETLEEAVIREAREETGIELDEVEYLVSFPNVYR